MVKYAVSLCQKLIISWGETIHMYKNIETRKTKEESSAVPQSYSEKYKEKAYHLICRRLVRGKKKKKIETIRVIVIASMS